MKGSEEASRLREIMTTDWPFLGVPVQPVALIMDCLRANWPQPIALTPSRAGLDGEDRLFLRALVALQDAGWVMCEALLAGSGHEPCALGAVLTAKGMNEFARPWLPRPEPGD